MAPGNSGKQGGGPGTPAQGGASDRGHASPDKAASETIKPQEDAPQDATGTARGTGGKQSGQGNGSNPTRPDPQPGAPGGSESGKGKP